MAVVKICCGLMPVHHNILTTVMTLIVIDKNTNQLSHIRFVNAPVNVKLLGGGRAWEGDLTLQVCPW